MKRIAGLLLLSLSAGCATVTRTSVYHGVRIEEGAAPIETIEVANSGWKMFKCIPLASGNPRRPDENTCRWFTDTVTLENNIVMVREEMARTKATSLRNLISHRTEESFLFILLTRSAYHTSAVLYGHEPSQKPTRRAP